MKSSIVRTVLIFAHECAPFHAHTSTIGAQRVAQFAKHLPKFGWRAIVICCDASKRGAGYSDQDASRVERMLRDASSDESLIVPTASLKWDGLLDRWWRASMGGSPGAMHRVLLRKPLTALKQLTYGDYSSAWQPCAKRAAEVVRRFVQIDACIGEHTPDAGVVLARWFGRLTGVPWVADFRDPVLRPFTPTLRMLYQPRIRRLLSTAAHVVSVNEYWASLDRQMFDRPTTSIPNGFDPDEFPADNKARLASTFNVAYCGNINPQIQAIGPFLEGLRIFGSRLPDREIAAIRFVYRGNGAAHVSHAARTAGVASMVDAAGHVPRDQSLRILQAADALLLLSTTESVRGNQYFARGLYPAKTFEYFGARRPILCIPGDGGMLDRLIRDTRTGVVLSEPADIAEYLLQSYRFWREGRCPLYEPNEDLVRQFTRQRLTGTLAAVLERIAGPQGFLGPMPNGAETIR